MPSPTGSTPSLRDLPKVDRLLAAPEVRALLAEHPRSAVVGGLREALAQLRAEVRAGVLEAAELEAAAVARRTAGALARRGQPYYRRVINATGVVLHTNLGRAPLPEEAVKALAATAGGAQRLELDLESGQRGGRDEGSAALLREATGCEAATVVNNNAAATLLVLAALARGRKVLLSRGEMVEIGGSFRVPEVMRESGAQLVEVGTTNRTHLEDYRRALDPEAGMILKVHASNYRILGFTAEVPIEDLVALGHEHGIPVVHDLGSGCLVDLERHGRFEEPWVRRSVAAGADVVCFSGDKLLGGPQAGILVGRKEAVERCRKHPLFRALRPGRLVYTALEATLRLYGAGEEAALAQVPALARLVADPAVLRRRAQALVRRLRGVAGLTARSVPCASQAGSGSLPAVDLASWGVAVEVAGLSADGLAAALRRGEPAILPRIEGDRVLLDLRTVGDEEISMLADRLGEIGASKRTYL
jgi:L-seryl-tRNA(Ser) seleniumtransferase